MLAIVFWQILLSILQYQKIVLYENIYNFTFKSLKYKLSNSTLFSEKYINLMKYQQKL